MLLLFRKNYNPSNETINIMFLKEDNYYVEFRFFKREAVEQQDL